MLLYLHIPFCDSKCHYCAFNSFTQNHHLKERYIKALLGQLHFELRRFKVQKLRSIYIGGGTPSTLPAHYYEPIFAALAPFVSSSTEITIEANPNSASKEWLQNIKSLGINRISFGVQSFDEAKLRFLGRAHSPKEAIRAIEEAAKAGIEHINLDLIYDTVCDTKELLQRDIEQALALPIDHISAYALTLEPNTPFADKQEYKKENEELAYFIRDIIPFCHYEVSNFGYYRSLHNLGYWQLHDYIGVGAGAVGFFQDRRFYPPQDLHDYIKEPLAIKEELLTPQDLRLEKIFLGLRSCVGVEESLVDRQKALILLDEQKLIKRGSRLYNPNYFLADELALFLS